MILGSIEISTLQTKNLKSGIWRCLCLSFFMASAYVSVSVAQEMTVEETIEARQHQLRDLGGAFKSVRDQLRQKKPNIYLIQPTIMQIKDMADAQYLWFPNGTGPEAGFETEAKSEIWKDPKGFANAQQEFSEVIPKFVELAYAKDIDGLKKHYPIVGRTCKGCHDKYREEEDD